jgi:mRNA-degrading endonuclease RelE of RelBE toxin-antitoxin system
MNPAIEKELREQLDQLPAAQQRQVLDFARALATKKLPRASGRALRRFAGTIAKADLAMIVAAIGEGCEGVNPDEW